MKKETPKPRNNQIHWAGVDEVEVLAEAFPGLVGVYELVSESGRDRRWLNRSQVSLLHPLPNARPCSNVDNVSEGAVWCPPKLTKKHVGKTLSNVRMFLCACIVGQSKSFPRSQAWRHPPLFVVEEI